MRIALAQINNTVGDLDANAAKILSFARRAGEGGAELVVFPELALTGYPPRDLIEKRTFLARTAAALGEIAKGSADLKAALVVGYVAHSRPDAALPAQNALAVIEGGRVVFDQRKMLLPTYDVFDEIRYFEPAESQSIFEFRGRRIALSICEDAWNDKMYWRRQRYDRDPVEELAKKGAEILISINASPWNLGKREQLGKVIRRGPGVS
jgi:NAD+ synthase/NAD+ synthase (glutamine-hydrolysing)